MASSAPADSPVDEALDNDVLLKAVRYGAASGLLPAGRRIGVLGAARYVVAGRIRRKKLDKTSPAVVQELKAVLARAEVLEPSEQELARAAELERAAQQQALALDAGESQLAAMVVGRAIQVMTTGDKRAIESLEKLVDDVPWLTELCGRVRCLEQVVLEQLAHSDTFELLRDSVCSDVDADKTLSICFSCYSGGNASHSGVEGCLVSYIDALRGRAKRILAPTL